MNQPGLQIYLRPRMTLTFDLLTTRVDRPMPLTRGPLMSIFIKIGLFVFKISCYNLVTDGRTDGQTENIMPPPVSLDWSRHKIQWYSSNLHGDYKVTLLIQTRSEYHISCHSETGRILFYHMSTTEFVFIITIISQYHHHHMKIYSAIITCSGHMCSTKVT